MGLLLGGYYCHPCLPDPCAPLGGTCTNVQWKGYVCSNEWYITRQGRRFQMRRAPNYQDIAPNPNVLGNNNRGTLAVEFGRTYRFVLDTRPKALYAVDANNRRIGATKSAGVLALTIDHHQDAASGHRLPAALIGSYGFRLDFVISGIPSTPNPTAA